VNPYNPANQPPYQPPQPEPYQPPAPQSGYPPYQPQQDQHYQQPEQQPGQFPQPQSQQQGDGPQQMYYSRPLDPKPVTITPEIQAKCEESRRKYPHLNLSGGEFVISDVKRHVIGLIQIWFIVLVVVAGIIGMLALIVSNANGDPSGSGSLPKVPLAFVALLLCALALIGGYIATYIYTANRFYLTNESVVQNLQFGLFTNHQQTVSLGNVEDASYMKHGLIQTLFDFGTLRLSTQGDETTYRFTFAAHPEAQIAKLNDAVEAFKNGRPVYDDDDPLYGQH
jgi:uncharacterized membrane protein YdbT with pleckstrin-like domain